MRMVLHGSASPMLKESVDSLDTMLSRSDLRGLRNTDEPLCPSWPPSQYFAFKWETTHTRTKSPIKVQWFPFLVQLKNVLKGETPSKISDRRSLNFVQRDIKVERKGD